MKFQLHLSFSVPQSGNTPAAGTVQLREGERGCTVSWPILPTIYMKVLLLWPGCKPFVKS